MIKKILISSILSSSLLFSNEIETNVESFLKTITKTDIQCANKTCKIINLNDTEKNKDKILEITKAKDITLNLNYSKEDSFVFDKENYVSLKEKCISKEEICQNSIKKDKLVALTKLVSKIEVSDLEYKSEGKNIKIEKIILENDNKFFKNIDFKNFTILDLANYNFILNISNFTMDNQKEIILSSLLSIENYYKNFQDKQTHPDAKSKPILENIINLLKEKYSLIIDEYLKENEGLMSMSFNIKSEKNC